MLACGGVRGMLEVCREACQVVELDDRGELEILAHHLLVPGQAVTHAPAHAHSPDCRRAGDSGGERFEDGATVFGRQIGRGETG